jgi:5'-3' exoribonuclease 1
MGIPRFFAYISKKYPSIISKYHSSPIDTLLIDANSLIHKAAQRTYNYGNEKKGKVGNLTILQEIELLIDEIYKITKPRKRVIFCIDGPAGMAKIKQQRTRRYRNVTSSSESTFDPNCISPGSLFLSNLSDKLLEYFTLKRSKYKEVIFSSEKVPGEGEHKLMFFVKFLKDKEHYCIYGSDADLIMLGLANFQYMKDICILREDYRTQRYIFVNVSEFRGSLLGEMITESEVSDENKISDFIFIGFLLGNDFLPHIEVLDFFNANRNQDTVSILFSIYRKTAPLTSPYLRSYVINTGNFSKFITELSSLEKTMLIQKFMNKDYFEDQILSSHIIKKDTSTLSLDYDNYLHEYRATHFNDIPIQSIVKEYITGLQWTIDYYYAGIPSWTWYYKYDYAPTLSDLSKHLLTYEQPYFLPSQPIPILLSLLLIMPHKSISCIPNELKSLIPLIDQKDISIDLSGKRKEYEAVVKINFDFDTLIQDYYSIFGRKEQFDSSILITQSDTREI